MEKVEIGKAEKLALKPQENYFDRYKKWKQNFYLKQQYNFKVFTTEQSCLICSECWPQLLTPIEELTSFDYTTKLLELNEYRGSWK